MHVCIDEPRQYAAVLDLVNFCAFRQLRQVRLPAYGPDLIVFQDDGTLFDRHAAVSVDHSSL